MEFVDYKCLESLLIEGEEMIATEGIQYKLSYRIKTAIGNLFKTIGGLITKLINTIRTKLGKNPATKFSTEELKKMGIDTFDPNEIKYYEVDSSKKSSSSKNGYAILNDVILSLDLFLSEINNSMQPVLEMGYKNENYLLSKLEKIEDKYESLVSKCDLFHSIINDDAYEFDFNAKSKDSVLKSLNELEDLKNAIIKKLEKNSKSFEDIYSKYGNNANDPDYLNKENHDKFANMYNKYIAIVTKCSGLISKIIADVQKI